MCIARDFNGSDACDAEGWLGMCRRFQSRTWALGFELARCTVDTGHEASKARSV